MYNHRKIKSFIFLISALFFSLFPVFDFAISQSKFEKFEIRVITPRFFVKKGKIELGFGLGVLPNQTYTTSAALSLGGFYHFSDAFSFGLDYSKMSVSKRAITENLDKDFLVKVPIASTDSWQNVLLNWTPM